MRNLQAWGWLAAGVVALGLNGMYHDRGVELAHRVAAEMSEKSTALAALVERASGQADQILAQVREEVRSDVRAEVRPEIRREAPVAPAPVEIASCRVSAALARAQSRIERIQNKFAFFEAMSAQRQALAELAADQEQIEREVEVQIARVQIPAVDPVKIRVVCPRVRVSVPAVRISPVRVRAVTLQLPSLPQL
jgi:hypothetical protein